MRTACSLLTNVTDDTIAIIPSEATDHVIEQYTELVALSKPLCTRSKPGVIGSYIVKFV